MPLLIDGYNLLHAPMPPGLSAVDEGELCVLLARGPWRGDRVVVVCDGVPKPGGAAHSPVDAVELVFSGRKRSADDRIIEMIDADSAPRRLVVVSNDRQIQKAARRRRAQVWSCQQLMDCLAQTAGSGATHRDKPRAGDMDEDEVNRWMAAFGFDEDARIDDGEPPEPPPWYRPDFESLDETPPGP